MLCVVCKSFPLNECIHSKRSLDRNIRNAEKITATNLPVAAALIENYSCIRARAILLDRFLLHRVHTWKSPPRRKHEYEGRIRRFEAMPQVKEML